MLRERGSRSPHDCLSKAAYFTRPLLQCRTFCKQQQCPAALHPCVGQKEALSTQLGVRLSQELLAQGGVDTVLVEARLRMAAEAPIVCNVDSIYRDDSLAWQDSSLLGLHAASGVCSAGVAHGVYRPSSIKEHRLTDTSTQACGSPAGALHA